ncbi:DUF6192 family protein [Streptomyces albidoflavus]|uniref:DUF6192 family protein n=1 Tax=Streptomyces albidoflavus TaxID=1886 RepID=UPI0036F1B23C
MSVAAAGRTVPGLCDRQLSEDERTIVHQNVARGKRPSTGSRPRSTRSRCIDHERC